jgi:hypothetical protein
MVTKGKFKATDIVKEGTNINGTIQNTKRVITI